ncbi:Furin protease 1 isoform 1-CRR [Fasciola hepatica]|uniref:Furin protease 1 isoform 1-CRR n=1 Tax=Fasciola hepatica TaxID=6192 RepID=A0A4E0RXE1_FASHE|nr:Furin protease 1 isoform 1-CRR [Fasciola hepatica]
MVGFDINIYPAYLLGFTGRGIRVSIVDDGLDKDHCDLLDNYNGEISTNLVDPEGTSKSPRPPGKIIDKDNSHGTECAGLVGATANNSRCSHGVAYNAQIGGVRVLGGNVTDSLESEAFSYRWDKVDIYCASWGPSDDGMTLDIPRSATLQSLRKVWRQGRGGKGTLYVFACGNGGGFGDNCGADGFVGQPEIISIGALDEKGLKAHYGESCASLRCSVPVGSLRSRGNILPTTSVNNECMLDFAGTSAAAPIAAGCFALALQSK